VNYRYHIFFKLSRQQRGTEQYIQYCWKSLGLVARMVSPPDPSTNRCKQNITGMLIMLAHSVEHIGMASSQFAHGQQDGDHTAGVITRCQTTYVQTRCTNAYNTRCSLFCHCEVAVKLLQLP
jgi:hypothetical protein